MAAEEACAPHTCFRSTAGPQWLSLAGANTTGEERVNQGPAHVEDTARGQKQKGNKKRKRKSLTAAPPVTQGPLAPLAQRVRPGRHGTGRRAGALPGLPAGVSILQLTGFSTGLNCVCTAPCWDRSLPVSGHLSCWLPGSHSTTWGFFGAWAPRLRCWPALWGRTAPPPAGKGPGDS